MPVPVGPGAIADFPIPFDCFASTGEKGRPTKLTPDLITDLKVLIASTPLGKKHLCTLLGIVHQTMRTWEKQGEQDRDAGLETRHTQFLDLFEKGQVYWRARLLHGQLTGDKTWAKYATALERLWPDEFGRRQDDTSVAKVSVQIGVVSAQDVRVLVQGSGDLEPTKALTD